MNKFKMIYQDEHETCFNLEINKGLFVSFEVLANGVWHYLAGRNRWSTFLFENGEFEIIRLGENEKLTLQIFSLIHGGFYELMRQLKQDSSYRLKIMHLLNDESRIIWDAV